MAKPLKSQTKSRLVRGILPELLVSQVRSTIPYMLEASTAPAGVSGAYDRFAGFVPAQVIRAAAADPARELTHAEYFKLCLSAHYATCATPVPTDVDMQIRFKLWADALPLADALEMSTFVLESRSWDFNLVSQRYQSAPASGAQLSGHFGEWFTVACAAYAAFGRNPVWASATQAQGRRQELLSAIQEVVKQHSEVFGELMRAQLGSAVLRASAAIAHNFGDLDRVIDMWELPIEDPLRLGFYKLAAKPFGPDGGLRYWGRLWIAGELYKSPIDESSMAAENHRHFALRKPKCLRATPDFLVPTGPFLDAWGTTVGQSLGDADVREVFEAMEHGCARLPKSWGYPRAMARLAESKAGLASARLDLRSVESFERLWSDEALRLVDEIPSRA